MATWETPATQILRVLTNDLDETPKYSDARLRSVLSVAAFQLVHEATFTQDFVIDIAAGTITPDPNDSDNNTDDTNFMNLMCLKAACIIDTGSAIKAANNAVVVKDFDDSVDLKGVATSLLALLEKGWCKTYEVSLDGFVNGDGGICAAVMGPFRTMTTGNYPYYRR